MGIFDLIRLDGRFFLPLASLPTAPPTRAMTQRVEKTDDYSSDEEKRTESEKSLALDAMDKPERTRGVLAMERLSERIGVNRIYLFLLYGGFALLGELLFFTLSSSFLRTDVGEAYILSLDQYTSGTYLTVATSVSFQGKFLEF